MSLRLGDTAPNFQAETTAGEIDFYEYLGDGWGLFFLTLPTIHRFVPQSWARTALLNEEFAKRNVKVLAISVDPLDKHHGWVNDINETQNCDR